MSRSVKAQALLAAGQTTAAHGKLDALPTGYDPNGMTTYARVCAALYGDRVKDAAEALATFRGTEYSGFNSLITPRAWLEALVARAAGANGEALRALTSARESAEIDVRQRPEDPFALALLEAVMHFDGVVNCRHG